MLGLESNVNSQRVKCSTHKHFQDIESLTTFSPPQLMTLLNTHSSNMKALT